MKRIYLQKAKNQIARSNTVRMINKQIVLSYIRERSPISRADIARETNLQRSTVSQIVESLTKKGLIEEIGEGSSNGGRKPTLLRIKTGVPTVIGIDITPKKTTIALADLVGTVLKKVVFETSPNLDYMTKQILKKVSKFANDNLKVNNLEIGISIPGVTDQTHGKILHIPYFNWNNWDICQQITKLTGLRVTVENDANAIALAELWFGNDEIRKSRNFLSVLIGEGIGTGIIFDGQIYHGRNGAAGEFGHMIVGTNGPVLCSCGSRECWEAHGSEKAVLARYKNFLEENKIVFEKTDIGKIIELANDGDKFALLALKQSIFYLGIGISNLIAGLSPDAVVVSGDITKAWKLISDEVSNNDNRGILFNLPKTKLFPSSLGKTPTLLGAFSLVIAQKFASAN